MTDNKAVSPPTDRTVAVVELLADHDESCTAAQVADTLELSRSTVAAILASLDRHGWVRRLPDLSYRLGPRLTEIGRAAQTWWVVPPGLDEALAGLSAKVRCGAALGMATETDMTFVAVTAGGGRLPAGIGTGVTLPLRAPAAAASIAFADKHLQEAWLANGPADMKGELVAQLAQVRSTGVGVWGIGAAEPDMLDVLADVVAHLADSPAAKGLRERVLVLLTGISGRPYSAADLVADTDLPLSYLAAPVFDAAGRAAWELQIGPLRPVGRAEREHMMQELICTAKELDMRASGTNWPMQSDD